MYNVISYWLKYYRSECKLTQQDVADLLGLERSSYTYYETGKTTPDIETLIRLSKIFHVDFFDLLSGCNTETGNMSAIQISRNLMISLTMMMKRNFLRLILKLRFFLKFVLLMKEKEKKLWHFLMTLQTIFINSDANQKPEMLLQSQ